MAVTERSRPTTADEVRDEVRAWLGEHWDPDLPVAAWWELLAESGWGVPTWPVEWFGRGLSRDLAAVVNQEMREAGAIGPPAGLGIMLAGPTIIAHGSDELKARYLPPIVTGQHAWCQLFSEPGAGSDLASLQTRATKDGDEWVVTGQKVWTSGAQTADLGMLLARTDVDLPKHKGISYFAFDMRQDGVDIRPLREMTGRAMFNEVFIDEARVADDALVGGLNEGWGAAMTTLANERASLGGGGAMPVSLATPGTIAGHLDRPASDFVMRDAGGRGGAFTGRTFGSLQRLAGELGRDGDPYVRQDLASLYTLQEIARYTVMRTKAAAKAGRPPGPEANTAKLAMSRMTRLARDAGLRILGADGMLKGPETPGGGVVQETALFSPAVSIYGGSDEVQRNIIGERVLGLPKEPGDDRTVPFRDLKVGTQRA